jgi:hypothetical protein
MFKKLLDKNYETELIEDAKPIIMKERLVYENIIMFILEFVNQNKLLISNIDLLLDKQNYWTSVDIFTLNIDETSKKLVSQLCKEFDKIFLLKIFEQDAEYYIEYNLRRICVLNAIKPYKSFTIYDFISPIKYVVNDKISIYLLPYLIEIIHLYSNLYDPNLSSTWEDTYKDIQKIEVFVDKEIETLLHLPKNNILEYITSTGGKECVKNKCKEINDKKIIEIKKLLVDFIKGGQYILCSEFYNMEQPTEIMEIISANIDMDFKLLVNFLSKFIEYGISYTKKTLYLPKEYQMEKYNFYLEIPFVKNIKKKHFLTMYNNTSYELINYVERNGFKYAEPITQLKFAYLSVWSSLIMQKTHGLHYEEFIEHIKSKKTQLKDLRKKINIYELKTNYFGTYVSENISKKLAMTHSGNKSSFYCFDF